MVCGCVNSWIYYKSIGLGLYDCSMRNLSPVDFGARFAQWRNQYARANAQPVSAFTFFNEVSGPEHGLMADHLNDLMEACPLEARVIHAADFLEQWNQIIRRRGDAEASKDEVHTLQLRIESMAWDPKMLQDLLMKCPGVFSYEQAWALATSVSHAKSCNMSVERKMAFMMGLHPRVGENCLVQRTDRDIVRLILVKAM